MISKKTILSLVVIICLSVALVSSAFAETAVTAADKAYALNRLLIVNDQMTEDKLNAPVKRWEALVYLVRAIGMEEDVTEDKESYAVSHYADVESTEWYSPYIEFCRQNGIVAGTDINPDVFSPGDNMSEKTFLSVAIRCLGYKSGVDYTWSDVYKKAYEVGLVKSSAYLTNTQDNNDFRKKDAIDVLYNMLKSKMKGKSVSVIQNLINKGIIEEATAIDAGVQENPVKAAITSVAAASPDSIQVMFNETLKEFDETDIEIYDKQISASISFDISSQAGNSLILHTSEQVPDREYVVVIKSITDAEGNIEDALESSFFGFRSAVTSSDFFRISKVEPLSKSSIKVYFTHPVNSNCELPSYYVITQANDLFVEGNHSSLAVKYQSYEGDSAIINLKNNDFVEGTEYTLRINGDMYSRYGARLNEGYGDSIRFTGKGTGSSFVEESLEVSAIAVLDSKTLEIWFNKEVDPFYGKQFLNYSVIDSNGKTIPVNKADFCEEVEKQEKVVRIGLADSLTKSKAYTVTINFLEDSMKQSYISNGRTEFTADFDSSSSLGILDAFAVDKRTVVVYFDRPLDSSTATNTSLYSVIGSSVITPEKVFYKAEGGNYIAKLFLPVQRVLSDNSTYKVRVSREMKFNSGSTSSLSPEYQFYGSSMATENVVIEKAVSISGDSLLVTFTKEISAEAPNLLVSNYSLEYRDGGIQVARVPLSVTYIDEKTLVLRFDKIDASIDYTLKCFSIKDLTGFSAESSSGGMGAVKVTKGK